MAFKTGISWTDHTWNPFQGCKKVSPGCLNCYMFRDKKRFGQDPEKVVKSKPATFYAPLKWKEPARVFVCSWSDFFIEDADPWRDEAWDIMLRTPHLTYQILTKRPENIIGRLPAGWPFKNVWLGVTAENQSQLKKRMPLLMVVPAAIRFVSVEPMISEMSFRWGGWIDYPSSEDGASNHYDSLRVIDWLIVGGESGPNARYMDPQWAMELKNQCQETNTPFFMKQMSGNAPIPDYLQCRQFPRD